MADPVSDTPDLPLVQPSFAELTRVSARIGVLSFGGPAGQIALMHRELVDERRWIGEGQFLHALNFCHLLPGPEAQQLATYIGWRLHGWRGGLVAGGLFVIPGALVMLGLSILYAFAAGLDWFTALFLGIKAAVLAIVIQALIRIGKRALDTRFKQGLALLAFLGLFLANLPFPLVVLGAGAIGSIVAITGPSWLGLKPQVGEPPAAAVRPWGTSLRAVLIGGAFWAAPMVAILLLLGQGHVLWRVGIFFSQLAVVTFGGAYAVLAYMAQEAVQSHQWLTAGQMADGLGLAETTPGPLIMVTQFVGFLAGYGSPAPFTPLAAGILAAALTTWVTFVPCFLWIFAFAPWIDRLERARPLKGGLAAITAAVVGVIANLTIWFALHVLFRRVEGTPPLPDWTSLDWRAAAITVLAAVLLFRFRFGVLSMLGACAAAGLALSAV